MAPVMWRACPSTRSLRQRYNGVQVVGKIHPDQGNRKCNVPAWPSTRHLPKSSRGFSLSVAPDLLPAAPQSRIYQLVWWCRRLALTPDSIFLLNITAKLFLLLSPFMFLVSHCVHSLLKKRLFLGPRVVYRLEKQFMQLARRIPLRWRKERGDTTFRSRDLAGDRHTQTHTQTHTHSHTGTDTHRHRHWHRHTQTQTHTDTHTQTQTHTDTNAHTHKHTHTHTHTVGALI